MHPSDQGGLMLLRGLIVGLALAVVAVAAATDAWWLLAIAAFAYGLSWRLIAPRRATGRLS